MKKLISVLLCVAILCVTCVGAFAASQPQEDGNSLTPSPRWTLLSTMRAALIPQGGSVVHISGIATAYDSSTKIVMSVKLQKLDGSWKTITSWGKSGDVVQVSTDRSVSPGTYRVLVSVKVYDGNGNYVESASMESNPLTVQ